MTDKVGWVPLDILYFPPAPSTDNCVQLDPSSVYHFGVEGCSPEQGRSTDVPFKAQMRLDLPKTPSAEMSSSQNLGAYR